MFTGSEFALKSLYHRNSNKYPQQVFLLGEIWKIIPELSPRYPEVIKRFACLSQLSMKLVLLINVKYEKLLVS